VEGVAARDFSGDGRISWLAAAEDGRTPMGAMSKCARPRIPNKVCLPAFRGELAVFIKLFTAMPRNPRPVNCAFDRTWITNLKCFPFQFARRRGYCFDIRRCSPAQSKP
jgi:hypothetical protein